MKHSMLKKFIAAGIVLAAAQGCAKLTPLTDLQKSLKEQQQNLTQLMQQGIFPSAPTFGQNNDLNDIRFAVSQKMTGMEGLDLENLTLDELVDRAVQNNLTQQTKLNPQVANTDNYSITKTSSNSFVISKNTLPYMSGINSCAYKRIDLIAPTLGKAYAQRKNQTTVTTFKTGKKKDLNIDLNAAVCSEKGQMLPTREILTNLGKIGILDLKR